MYVFARNPTTNEWSHQIKLVPDDGTARDYFGSSVAIHDDFVIVGAEGDDDKGKETADRRTSTKEIRTTTVGRC